MHLKMQAIMSFVRSDTYEKEISKRDFEIEHLKELLKRKHELEKRDLEIKRLKKLLEAPPPEETDSLIEEKTDSVIDSESESGSEESESETESEESASESESEESDSDYEPDEEDNSRQDRMQACSHCKELGHKITRCPLRWNTVIRNLRCNQEVLRDYVIENE